MCVIFWWCLGLDSCKFWWGFCEVYYCNCVSWEMKDLCDWMSCNEIKIGVVCAQILGFSMCKIPHINRVNLLMCNSHVVEIKFEIQFPFAISPLFIWFWLRCVYVWMVRCDHVDEWGWGLGGISMCKPCNPWLQNSCYDDVCMIMELHRWIFNFLFLVQL